MKNRLKELRQSNQLSQAELARKLEVTRQAINGFESGKFDPSLEMAFKIASLLNVAIEDIFIYKRKNSMGTLLKQVKNFFGLEFGFERFDPQAIEAITFGQNEAARMGCDRVKPEHLFAGLLANPQSTSAALLQACGATSNVAINQNSGKSSKKVDLSSSSKFILELALQIVRLQSKKSIGTEHLLWGLIRLGETGNDEINDLFRRHEVDLTTLNQRLIEII